MIKVGIAGIGFMGWIHWLAYKNVPGIEVVAITSRDEKKRNGDWTDIQGNFGPPGEMVDLSNLQTFDSIEGMLESTDVDLVDICLPPSLHRDASVQVLESGRHVFCEKPLAVSLADCDAIVRAAQANERQLLVGHVLPFFPEYSFVRSAIAEQRFGKLLGGNFKRVVSDPTWLDNFYDVDVVGGPLIDLHVHDAHLIRMLFGMPVNVDTNGRFREDVVEYCESIFRFEDPDLVVASSSGVIKQQGRPFNHAFEIHFEKATAQFEFAAFADNPESMPLKFLLEDGSVERPSIPPGSDIAGFEAEIAEVVRAIDEGSESPILGGELARDAISMCHWQSESARLRRPVTV